MRIVMTLVARNEADVLEVNLRAHRALGVDAFAILDNGSTDGTAEILERWRAAGLAHVITDPEADTDEVFREWQTRLAKLAATELGADWVINNDADEFWLPVTGTLRDAFAAIPADAHGLLAPRLEFVPRPDGPEPFWERMTVRERGTRVLPKMAHRATEDVRVGPGSHHVSSASLGLPETAGKPSLRGLRRRPAQPSLIAPASEFSCAILHLPLRSFEQFKSRLEIGLRIARTRESAQLEERIAEVLDPEAAERRWRELIGSDDEVRAATARGELVVDTRLRDLVRTIGPPQHDSVEPPAFAPVPLDAEALRAARAEVVREALAGLAHNHAQALGERDAAVAAATATDRRLQALRKRSRERGTQMRRKLRAAQKRARKLDRRLRRIESSRWWRLRPRLPRRRSK